SGGCASTLDNSTNGTTAGAATIPFNTNVTGLISPTGDIDHYKFVITTGGTATVTLTTLPADYDLKILNSAGTQLAISQAGGTSSETISRTYTAGTYYAQVYGYNGANNASTCYTLRVALGTASRENELVNAGTFKAQVYPNPAKNRLNINVNNLPGKATIQLVDINGRVVMAQQMVQNNTSLDISKAPAGIYLVRVNNADGKNLFQDKFVKE
ncbi:MAG: T9SS type A sorting domain-containing protein, partial [Dinghuibacter sp.]|nr:T9SS type A sorting domain-containing protein [Dinghuibacter sp.]